MKGIRAVPGLLGLAGWLAIAACKRTAGSAPAVSTSPAASFPVAVTPTPAYVPGLGELMTFQQMRHAKLWWAGEAENWELAAYELAELKEGFEDAARFHPTQKDVPVPIDQAIDTIVKEPLERLGDAIAKKDRRAFASGYDTLTEGCNACHQATSHGFNVVQRPKQNTFTNQSFAPAK